MKIRITTGAIPGFAEGAIVDATPNGWYTETRPRWFVSGKGIYAYEAEELQECGHPVSSIASTDEGTYYCSECANQ